MRATGLLAIILVSICGAHAQAPNDPAQHIDCRNGAAMELAGQSELTARHMLACAQVPGQAPMVVAKSRLSRLGALQKLGDNAAAEAELVALTSAPIADFDVFHLEGAGVSNIKLSTAKPTVGVTQARLIATRAMYRLAANDAAEAVKLAELAMRASGRNPAAAIEIVAAWEVRAKARFRAKDEPGAISDVVAAYVRNSEDAWVRGQVEGFPAEAKAHLASLRQLMVEQARAHLAAHDPIAMKIGDEAKRQEALTKAAMTLPYVEAEEIKVAGTKKWDTTP